MAVLVDTLVVFSVVANRVAVIVLVMVVVVERAVTFVLAAVDMVDGLGVVVDTERVDAFVLGEVDREALVEVASAVSVVAPGAPVVAPVVFVLPIVVVAVVTVVGVVPEVTFVLAPDSVPISPVVIADTAVA